MGGGGQNTNGNAILFFIFFSRNKQIRAADKSISITPRTKTLTLLWSGEEIQVCGVN